MTIRDLEITVDDELLGRSPRIMTDQKIYIPYCTKDQGFCKNFPNEGCIYYQELLLVEKIEKWNGVRIAPQKK